MRCVKKLSNIFTMLVLVIITIGSGLVFSEKHMDIAEAKYKVPSSGLPMTKTGGGYCADIPEGIGTKSITSNGIVVSNVDVLTDDTLKLAKIITKKFPEVKTIGGFRRCDGYSEHPSGKALDIMVANPQGYNKELGLKIKDWLIKNADDLDVKWAIWDKYSYSKGSSPHNLGNRGSNTADHKDHVHVFLKGTGKFNMDGGGTEDSGDVCEPTESGSSTNEEDKSTSDKIFMVGDSITNGASSTIKSEIDGIEVDGKDSRSYSGSAKPDGKTVLKDKASSYNKKGAVVIVALGTNGGITEGNIKEIKKMYDKASLYFVNIYVAKSKRSQPSMDSVVSSSNKALKSSGVKVIDWNSKGKPELIKEDGYGVHTNDKGNKVFAEIIKESLKGKVSGGDSKSDTGNDCDTEKSSAGSSDGEYTGALEFNPFIDGKPVQNTTGIDYKNKDIGASEGYLFSNFFKNVIYVIMIVALVLTALYIVSIAILILGIALDSAVITDNKLLRKIGGNDFTDNLRAYGITGSLKQIGIRFGIPIIVLNLVILGVVGQVQNILVNKLIEIIGILF